MLKYLRIKQKFIIFASSKVFITVEPKTKRMELQEGLDFYRRCLEYTKLSIQEVMKDKSIPEWRKGPLIDKLLDRMIEFQKNIDMIEELLR